MEIPKDYGSLYREPKKIDGVYKPPTHREFIDPNQLYAKLSNLSKKDRESYAIDTLQKHYNSVFQAKPDYRVYINYFDDRQAESIAYLVRIEKNKLREVRQKLPLKGNYRLFFKNTNNHCEEVEEDEAVLPFHEKDGCLNIYCHVFPR